MRISVAGAAAREVRDLERFAGCSRLRSMTLFTFHCCMATVEWEPGGGMFEVTRGYLIPSDRHMAAFASFLETSLMRIAVT
jgi:hypothetical protein